MVRYFEKRFFAGLLFVMLVYFTARGQESFPGLDNIIPPSPEAGALMKGVNVPVSHYTGIPSVSVPLWTLKGRKLSMPVSLSYHASGVKVDEIAGWVGLGWSLNAGGAISRTVRGKADDGAFGFLTLHGNQIPGIEINPDELGRWEIPGEDTDAQIEYLRRIADNKRDGEPDIFQFNFNGRSGKFFFNVDGEVVLQSKENLKIVFAKDAGGLINSWQIVDESGNIYSFGTNAAMERTAPANTLGYQGEFYTSTWYLQSVKSANNEDLFWFDYDDYTKSVKYSMPQRKVSGNVPKWEEMFNFQLQFIEGKYLSKITYPGGQLLFTSEKIYGYPGGEIRGLTEIAIKDLKTGITVKTYRFSYSFFPSVGCGTQQDYLPPCRRLRLDKISEIPGVGKITKPPYMFFYDETPLPPRGSFSRDHWGFYNGATNDHLVPAVRIWNFHDPDLAGQLKQYKGMVSFSDLADIHLNLPDVAEDVWEFNGADREPNQEMSQAGILKKIVYPTGGSTVLEYEPHDFGYYSTPENKQTLKVEAKNDFFNNSGINEEKKLVVKYGQEVKVTPLFYIIEGSIKDQSPETRIPSDFSGVYIRTPVRYDSDGDTVYSCLYKKVVEFAGGLEYEDKIWLDSGTYYVGVFAKDMGDLTRVVLDYKAGSIYDTVYKVFSQEYSYDYLKAGDKYFPDDISEYRSGSFTLDSMDYPIVQFEFLFRSKIHPNRISSVGLEHPLSKVVVTKVGVNAEVVFESSYYDEDLIRWDAANEEYIYRGQLKKILKPGRYQVEFIPRINSEFGFISLKWKKSQKINNYKTTGGLRIKRIIEKDGDTDTLGITDFNYIISDNGEERSSGVLMSYPFYYDLPKENYYLGSSMVSDLDNLHVTLYSSGKSVTGSTSGSHIGYSRVQVSRPGAGHTIYDFSSAIDYPDISSNEFPFPPEVSFDQKRGQLKEKRIYRDNGKLRQKEVYIYNDVHDTLNRVFVPAIKVVQKNPASDYAYLFKKYYMHTAWNITRKKEVFAYDLEGESPVKVTEEYVWDPGHLQLGQTRRWESDSSQLEDNFTYPDDLIDDKSPELTMLRSKHMVNVVLKSETFRNENRISGLKTKYGIFHSSMIYPKTIEKLEGDEYRAVMHVDRYDDKGNIIQYHREGDVFNSFNWDDDKRFPIAKVVNSQYKDNLQDYSGDALVTKYNYHPFWGVTSETGPNNTSIYYDYDNYGRMISVKNNEQKILKAYNYHLKSYEGDTSRPGFTTKELVFSTNPEELIASDNSIAKFCGLTLQVSGGTLGTAAEWVWYDDFCGGNEIARGAIVEVYPVENTQYFVRAEGEANKTSCASVSINIVDPSVHPVPDVLAFEDFGTGHNLQDVLLNYNACDPLSIECDVDWLNIQNITNKSFGVDCKPNTLISERQANITITGNGFEEIITVTQAGSGGF